LDILSLTYEGSGRLQQSFLMCW